MAEPLYLGDGLYAEFVDEFQIRLFASDGARVTNQVFLEPIVFYSLLEWSKTSVPFAGPMIAKIAELK